MVYSIYCTKFVQQNIALCAQCSLSDHPPQCSLSRWSARGGRSRDLGQSSHHL